MEYLVYVCMYVCMYDKSTESCVQSSVSCYYYLLVCDTTVFVVCKSVQCATTIFIAQGTETHIYMA